MRIYYNGLNGPYLTLRNKRGEFDMQKNRALRLLKFLLAKDDYISMKEIAAHLEVSPRTVYNDMNTPAFKRLLCGASVEKKTKIGVKLIVLESQMKRIRQLLDRQNFEPKAYDIPSFGSINSILFLLFSRATPVTADFIAKYLYKSKTQLKPDFKRAEH